MARTIRVEVTKRDIALGKTHSPCDCPVARALGRAFGVRKREGRIFVDSGDIRVYQTGDRIACDVPFPGPVLDFVDNFDNHRKVEPFAFDLELPDSPPHTEGGES